MGTLKILGMSFDGYPIYGPWGYNASGAVARETSSYRLRTTAELQGARPQVNTVSNVTYAVTVVNDKFVLVEHRPDFLRTLIEEKLTFSIKMMHRMQINIPHFFTQTMDGIHQTHRLLVGYYTNSVFWVMA